MLECKQNLSLYSIFYKIFILKFNYLFKMYTLGDFITRLFHFLCSIANIVDMFCYNAREVTAKWVLVIPLIHLLRGEIEPFQDVPPALNPQFDSLRTKRQSEGPFYTGSGAKYDFYLSISLILRIISFFKFLTLNFSHFLIGVQLNS